MKFHWLTGDMNWLDYGAKWISNRQNNGEFDYYFIIELLNWENAVGKREAPAVYNVSLSVVSPQEAKDHIKAAMECCGLDDEMLAKTDPKHKDETLAEVLHSYGVSVSVWGENGSNARKLIREAKKQAKINGLLFGFAMDRPVNMIGTTGWEALRGNIMGGLERAT